MSKFLLIFTWAHTAVSLVAILAGFMVTAGLVRSRGRQLWTFLFFCSTAVTIVSGFFFPFHGVTPAILLGVISLFPLTLAVLGRYRFRLAGAWRGTYVVSLMTAFYLNFFVLIIQSFEKIPTLTALAPTQKEPPFALVQGAAFLFFLILTVKSFKNFRPLIP